MRAGLLSTLKTSQADAYRQACRIALHNDLAAEATFRELLEAEVSQGVRAQLQSDLATIAAFRGHTSQALEGFGAALALDPECVSAQCNRDLLRSSLGEFTPLPATTSPSVRPRIAVLSLLFNWPSTGGGTVHTKELVEFLKRDGYDIRHFYAQQPEWGLGNVEPGLGEHVQPVTFAAEEWQPNLIRQKFRSAVDAFAPDCVIITDSWNTKVLLAEAVQDHAYFLRIAALECVCPLNNVRLLFEDGRLRQCDRNQLASPDVCRDCVAAHGGMSGGLHQAERALAGFHDSDYAERLHRAFAQAAGVLAVNPFVADLVAPYTPRVHVIPSGFDPQRFPQQPALRQRETDAPHRILFAGLTQELMKGFFVLQQAMEILWQQRRDFELWVTADPPAEPQPQYLRYVGWQSQEDLPGIISECDLLVFPTVAQEALGRTAVEAMGCRRPVVASRLGGLPWVVDDGVTGLLAEPGDPHDLAHQIATLLDDTALRERMGHAGREKFERTFIWDVIVEKYRELFATVKSAVASIGPGVKNEP